MDKVYVHVGKFGVKKIDDSIPAQDKVKKVAVAAMLKATTKALEKSALLTTKPPKEKDAKAFYVDGSVVALGLVEKGGQKIMVCKVSFDAGDWNLKSKKGTMNMFPSGGGKLPVDAPDDAGRVAGDVAFLLDSVTSDVITKQLLKPLETKAKALAKKEKKAKR